MAHMRLCHLLHSRKSGKVNLGLSLFFKVSTLQHGDLSTLKISFISNHIIHSKLSKVNKTYGKLEMHNILQNVNCTWPWEAPP